MATVQRRLSSKASPLFPSLTIPYVSEDNSTNMIPNSPSTSIIPTSIRPSSSSTVHSSSSSNGSGSGSGSGSGGGTGGGTGGQGSGSGGNNGSGSGSGSTTYGTTGTTSSGTGTTSSGTGTVSFKGGAAPRIVIGYNYWGLVIAAGVIAGVGAIVVD